MCRRCEADAAASPPPLRLLVGVWECEHELTVPDDPLLGYGCREEYPDAPSPVEAERHDSNGSDVDAAAWREEEGETGSREDGEPLRERCADENSCSERSHDLGRPGGIQDPAVPEEADERSLSGRHDKRTAHEPASDEGAVEARDEGRGETELPLGSGRLGGVGRSSDDEGACDEDGNECNVLHGLSGCGSLEPVEGSSLRKFSLLL